MRGKVKKEEFNGKILCFTGNSKSNGFESRSLTCKAHHSTTSKEVDMIHNPCVVVLRDVKRDVKRKNGTTTYYRIRAVKDMPWHGVKAGTLGGWVDSLSNVRGRAWVADDAIVTGGSYVTGDALVSGTSQMRQGSIACNNAVVSGNSIIVGGSRISRNATVSGSAKVVNQSKVSGNAIITGKAVVKDSATVTGNAVISGFGRVENYATVKDHVHVYDNGVVSTKICVQNYTQVFQNARVKKSLRQVSIWVCGDVVLTPNDDMPADNSVLG